LTERGTHTALDALAVGAVDVVAKPKVDAGHDLEEMLQELRTKIKIAATIDVSHWKHKIERPKRLSQTRILAGKRKRPLPIKVIAIGASTGGTEALREVLTGFPSAMPGIVIVQHLPAAFTRQFAARLNSLCSLEVKEAEDGDLIMRGQVLVAPGAKQLRIVRAGLSHRVEIKPGEPVSGHCPSVDVLMNSVADQVCPAAIGVLLTGMGRDGALGMQAMRKAGARTLAQDQATCVVFGMPKAAWDLGAAEQLVPLPDIAPAVLELLGGER
ncbi:MAG: chemotaxis-specific protein-glutamate methyltransferase CheB, partial [Planctomycetota bacterium]